MSLLNPAGLCAVWKRQLGSMLGNPLAYLFILAFVLLTGGYLFLLAGDGDAFFTRNIADLGLLHDVMPWALAFLLPLLAMNAWASERESGTEELLLTMPMSPLDAALGKYLAIVTYFTIALVCSAVRDLAVLEWLGDPDIGLLFANYVGWWLAGLAFAAFGLLASVLVTMPAIACVIGIAICALLLGLAMSVEWFDDFNRGVIALADVVVALSTALVGLAGAVLLISSRRWRPGNDAVIAGHVLSLVFICAIAVHVARSLDRWLPVDADVTEERLSSLSPHSERILAGLAQPVAIHAFISKDLPSSLSLKRQEIEDKLSALGRIGGDRVSIQRHYPADPLDEQGALATRQYGIKPRDELVETESGREKDKIFLSAAVTSAGRTQLIEYFDPGLSVEYELVRAVRAVSAEKKRVLGIAMTDVEMMGGFDPMRGQSPSWQVIDEWKRQYDVREVNLDSPVSSEIEVLVVAQPSSLTDPQIRNLHDHIWSGGPTLLMEDPAPMGPGPNLSRSQPKKAAGGGMFGAPPDGPQKGDIQPLFDSLGIDLTFDRVLWSGYNPSHEFRGVMPEALVWARADQTGSMNPEAEIAQGLPALLMLFPGGITVADDKAPGLNHTWLAKPVPRGKWGTDSWEDHFGRSNPFQQAQLYRRSSSGELPLLAVQITGKMPSAYPKPDPSAPAAPPAEPPKEGEAAPAEPPKPAEKTGVASAKDIHVVVVSDVDFAHDMFFQFYRNAGKQYNQAQLRFLLDLRNVQFVANAVDALAGDQDLLALRRQQARPRPLKKLEDLRLATDQQRRTAEEVAVDEFEAAKAKAQGEFEDKVAKIRTREDLDEGAREQLAEQVRQVEQRKLELVVDGLMQKQEASNNEARIKQRRIIGHERITVRWLVILVPSLILMTLVAFVFVQRLARERSHIPAARKRSHA
ncbi:MAG TPA: Gldg family protein [Planctomycetota bacterium]|nr:Gldg family protein [Planctomycetota bacterium]